MNTKRIALFVVLSATVLSTNAYCASSQEYLNQLLKFVKWGCGAIGVITAAASVFFGSIGVLKKMNGDPEGDKQLKNALFGAVFSAVSWAAFAMIVSAGAEAGTAIKNVDQGFRSY